MEHNTDITATNDLAADQPERPSSATRVADIMSRKLVALSAHHTFGQAVQLMTDSPFPPFSSDSCGWPARGVLSDRDVLRALGRTPNWQAKNVSGVMAHKIFRVARNTFFGGSCRNVVAPDQLPSRCWK